MNEAVIIVGIVCVAAAVVGGGVKLAGGQFPVISSIPRQLLLGLVGLAGIILGFTVETDNTSGARTMATSSTTTTATTTTTTTPEQSDIGSTSSTTTSRPPAITYLADLDYLPGYSAYRFSTGQANVGGTTYTRAILLDPQSETPGYVEYDLSREYVSLETAVGLRDDVPSDTAMLLELFGDGNLLFSQTVNLGDVVPVSVNVTEVLRLRLQATDLSDSYPVDVFAVFADARLIG